MIKIRINYVGTESYTTIISRLSFEKFIEEVFRHKIYYSICEDDSFPMAINTRNITNIAEEYYASGDKSE